MEAGQILGPYRIIGPLGSGGMGEVYQAEDTRLDRMVAIKVLPSEFSEDADRLSRFEREAKAVAALEHPNVVTIHSVEEIDGIRLLTMELVKGGTLADELRGGVLPLRRILDIAVPLADGLAAAHAEGVVHRDLKPANVMLTDDGRVKILDFGLAKLHTEMTDPDASHMPTEAITEEGRILGTVTYMSPEQVKAQPVDERSDIFSTGVILYQMSTGTRPFRGDSWADVGSAILRDTPTSVTELNTGIPDHLGRIVGRCLEKDRTRRYQSAVDLRNDLDGLAREADTASLRPGVRATSGRRSWMGKAAAAVAVVALALTAWLVLPRGNGTAPAPAPGPLAGSIRSIAVLPFENDSADPEDEFFVDGMQDALITELSKTDLRVIGQSSSMRFRATDSSLSEVAAALDVGGLVEGSVLREGNQVRVSVRLLHGPSEEYLWGQSYLRDLTDVLVLTSELAQAIADEVEIAMTPEQEQRLARSRSVDPAAWELYVRGMHHANRFTGPDFIEARRLLEEALQVDAEFAEAWAGLALTYIGPLTGGGLPDPQLAASARRAIDRAIEFGPGLADAHAMRGIGLLVLEWDWAAAEREFAIALEIKPNHAIARHGHADLLTLQGRAEEAVDGARLGRQYDPLSRLASVTVVAHLLMARRYEEAINEFVAARERIPEMEEHNAWVADAYWELGRYQDAVSAYAALWRGRGRDVAADAMITALADGDPSPTARAVAETLAASATAERSALDIATWYARAGDADAALTWLERALELRIPLTPIYLVRPEFDLVRDDPRYAVLAESMDVSG